jgi:hypothetical protein
MRTVLTAVVSCLATTLAQAQVPTEFSADAKPIAAEALKAHLAGKVFHVALADGTSMRLEYRGGHYFVDTNRGARVNGTWRTEGTQLCTDRVGRGPRCNEARLVGDLLHVKLDSGEVAKFEPR